MDFRTLQSYMTANPFAPFRLVMTDGRSFEIRFPAMLMPGRTTAVVGVALDPAAPDVFDQFVSVANIHIVRIEPLPVAAPHTP